MDHIPTLDRIMLQTPFNQPELTTKSEDVYCFLQKQKSGGRCRLLAQLPGGEAALAVILVTALEAHIDRGGDARCRLVDGVSFSKLNTRMD